MPSTATITAFYTFAAGTKSMASQVNANFDSLRGHMLPIDPNTVTAINQTHDLGSSEYRWRAGYFQKIDLSITSTASMIIQGLSSGGMDFKKNDVSLLSVSDQGYSVRNTETMNLTMTAAVGDMAIDNTAFAYGSYTTTGHIPDSTCTLSTNGRPVMIALTEGYIRLVDDKSASKIENNIGLSIVRNGTILPAQVFGTYRQTTSSTPITDELTIPPGAFFTIDVQPAGTYNYSLYLATISATTVLSLTDVVLIAYEL